MNENVLFTIQQSLNKKIVFAVVVCAAYAYFNEKKIAKLASEIKELKQTKGV